MRTVATRPPPAISEREFTQQVIDLAHYCGWRVYHTWSSVHSPAGFPDLVLVRRERLLFVELKSERGRLTTAQEEWLGALRAVCTRRGLLGLPEVAVWRPSDWDQIVEAVR